MTSISSSKTNIQTHRPLSLALIANFGGPKTDRARLQGIEPQRLWHAAFTRRSIDRIRQTHDPILENTFRALHVVGLEDPFEITPEITNQVGLLFGKYQPKYQIDKALLLIRSIIPTTRSFEFDGNRYFGLGVDDGGLEIKHDYNYAKSYQRIKHGGLLPTEIIKDHNGDRSALCLEFSFLLTVFLRSAGVQAHIHLEPNHAFVLAELDGKNYRLDIAQNIFCLSENAYNSDCEAICMNYNNKGNAFLKLKDPIEAINCFKKALEINPSCSIVWYNLGNAYLQLQSHELAINCFKSAIECDPSHAGSWYNMGNSYRLLGKIEKALECFREAVAKDLNYSIAWVNKGLMHQILGDSDSAIESYDKALQLDPKSFIAWCNKGVVHFVLGEYDAAIDCYCHAIESNPEFAFAWQNKGISLHAQGKIEEAEICYAKAKDLGFRT